ncbi:hypothetical protein A0H81_07271 [Grifola frondosa]|uniref:DUF6534 domain-containing protein n=1 Tax=Grifola frondosa TaxID=5627 RepID=A0A1C7M8Z8_GRIFR|nr:hypothetical protein A0H81_07271 [Grifola frondosa]
MSPQGWPKLSEHVDINARSSTAEGSLLNYPTAPPSLLTTMASRPTIPDLAGPQMLGFLLNWGLQGVLSNQVYLYHINFPNDSWKLKALVYGIFVFEWAQTILITTTAFEAFVYGWGNIESLTVFHTTWLSVPIMCGIVAAVVQIFYARRILILSQSRVLAGVVVVLALVQGSAALAGGIMLKRLTSASEQSTTTPAIATWLGGSALVDIVIAVTMTILLLRTKSGLMQSDNLVNRLVRLVIESGTLTASVALVDVILFSAIPNQLYHECPALILAKLYANTMVTSLNNRTFLAAKHAAVHETTSTFLDGFGRSEAETTNVHVTPFRDSDTYTAGDIPLRDAQKDLLRPSAKTFESV